MELFFLYKPQIKARSWLSKAYHPIFSGRIPCARICLLVCQRVSCKPAMTRGKCLPLMDAHRCRDELSGSGEHAPLSASLGRLSAKVSAPQKELCHRRRLSPSVMGLRSSAVAASRAVLIYQSDKWPSRRRGFPQEHGAPKDDIRPVRLSLVLAMTFI